MNSTPKPRLLAVLHLPPPFHGASLVGSQFVDSKLINSNFTLRAINLSTSHTLSDGDKFKWIKIWRTGGILLRCVRDAFRFKPDVIYITGNSAGAAFWKDLIVISVLKLTRARLFIHFHNKGFRKLDSSAIGRLILRFYFAKATAILLSRALRFDLANTVDRINVKFCPNGLSPSVVEKRKNSKRPRVLFLSNLIIEKGVIELLDACKLLAGMQLDFECVFAGQEADISAQAFNQMVIDRGLQDRVNYIGPVFGEAKQAIFAESEIFAFPTYYRSECFPLVIIEAMANGLPIISTDEGAIADLVQDGLNGWICERRNPHDLAKKLALIISDSQLRMSQGLESRKRYLENFTSEHFERQMCKILGPG